MADNVLLTPKIFAKMVLVNLGNALNVCRNMSKEVNREFGKPANNKPGSTVQVRRPYRFVPTEGLVYDPQPLVDTSMTVTLNRVAQVGYDWDSVEKTLSIREADALYAVPTALALATKINGEAATFCAQNAMNSAGTPGLVPSTEVPYLTAGDLIVAQGLPPNADLNLIMNRRMSSAFVSGTKALFNPQGSIGGQWEQGHIANSTLGYRVWRDQTIHTHTVGTYSGTPVVTSADQTGTGGNNGTMTLNTSGWGSGVSGLNKGDKFTIGSASSATQGGVEVVYPQNRQSQGYQQVFTVLETITDTAGAMALSIYPAITISGQYQNVNRAPEASAIITVIGASGASSTQGLVLHEQSFAFVSVPLAGPEPGQGATVEFVEDPETGISLRMIKAFDYVQSRHINRIDVLYDFASLYRELACVIQS